MDEELKQLVDMMNTMVNAMMDKGMFTTMATANYTYFIALIEAGFNEEQAMRIVERASGLTNMKTNG